MHTNCISYSSQNTHIIEAIAPDHMVTLYHKFNINVSNIVKNTKISYIECTECGLKFFSPQTPGDKEFYRQLQNMDWYFLHEDKTEFEFSVPYVRPEHKVLDVGSGRGVFQKYITCDHYQGLEFSEKAVELAKQDGINVQEVSIQDHAKTNPEFYDIVVSFQVLEHVENPNVFLESCLDCLKPGGTLIIAVPNNDGFAGKLTNHILNLPPHHLIHWNEQSLTYLTKLHNLALERVYKEKVTNIHRKAFCRYDIYKNINRLINRKTKIVDIGLIHKGLTLISIALTPIALMLKRYKGQDGQDGQTIIAVYKKS